MMVIMLLVLPLLRLMLVSSLVLLVALLVEEAESPVRTPQAVMMVLLDFEIRRQSPHQIAVEVGRRDRDRLGDVST